MNNHSRTTLPLALSGNKAYQVAPVVALFNRWIEQLVVRWVHRPEIRRFDSCPAPLHQPPLGAHSALFGGLFLRLSVGFITVSAIGLMSYRGFYGGFRYGY